LVDCSAVAATPFSRKSAAKRCALLPATSRPWQGCLAAGWRIRSKVLPHLDPAAADEKHLSLRACTRLSARGCLFPRQTRANTFDKLPSRAPRCSRPASLARHGAACNADAPQQAGQGRQRYTVRDLS
jgi:hypothetical protein